jgi:hypothetical protein
MLPARSMSQREKSDTSNGLEKSSSDLSPDRRGGDLRLLRLFHRRNPGHQVDILQLRDLRLVGDLVTKIQGNVDWNVDVWKPESTTPDHK